MADFLLSRWRSTFFTNGIILGAGLISGVLVARFLGVEERGLLAAVIYWPHFIAGIAAMGLNEGIVIHAAKTGVTDTLRATIFALSGVLALLVGLTGFILMPWLLGESRQEYLLFSQIYFLAFIPVTYLAQNFLAVDQGELNFQRFNTQRLIQAAAYPLLLVIFWATGILTVEYAAIAVLAGTAIVAISRVWRAKSALVIRPSQKEAILVLAVSIRLHFVNIVMQISAQADKMFLVLFSSNTELGLYVIAFTAANSVVSIFVQTYINIMLPTAARLEQEFAGMRDIVIPLRRLAGIIVLVTIILIPVMPYLIVFVFGKEFEAAGEYAKVLLLAFAFFGIRKALVYLLRSWKENGAAVLSESIVAIVLITGAYFALKFWGTIGLCVLVTIANALGTFLITHFFLKKTRLSVRQFFCFKFNEAPL